MYSLKLHLCILCYCAITCVALAGCNNNLTTSAPNEDMEMVHVIPKGTRADYPTKPGFYVVENWKYVYTIQSLGSRSERRSGKLIYNDHDVNGRQPGEVVETSLGRFVWMGFNGRYNTGWLNTLTYDRPVFDDTGEILPEVKVYFNTDDPIG